MTLSPDEVTELKAWWRDIIYNSDGSLNEEAILAELYDFRMVIREVPVVYDAITGGRMSKPNYFARDVLQQHESYLEELITDARREAVEEALAMIEAGSTPQEVLKEFPL